MGESILTQATTTDRVDDERPVIEVRDVKMHFRRTDCSAGVLT